MIYVYLCNVRAQTYAYSDLRFTCFTHAHIYICAYVCVRIPSMYLHNLHIQTTDEHIQTKTYSIRCIYNCIYVYMYIYISIRYVHTHTEAHGFFVCSLSRQWRICTGILPGEPRPWIVGGRGYGYPWWNNHGILSPVSWDIYIWCYIIYIYHIYITHIYLFIYLFI